jgi:hypothetical protein
MSFVVDLDQDSKFLDFLMSKLVSESSLGEGGSAPTLALTSLGGPK